MEKYNITIYSKKDASGFVRYIRDANFQNVCMYATCSWLPHRISKVEADELIQKEDMVFVDSFDIG